MRSDHRRFMDESCRLLGVAALVMTLGSAIAMADGDAASLPLQGPIPFEVFDLDGGGAISQQEFAKGTRDHRQRMGSGAPPGVEP